MDLSTIPEEKLSKYLEGVITSFQTIREKMEVGTKYYNYEQDIDKKVRAVVGADGKLITVRGLPNTIIKDNQYARALDQKRNFILAEKPNIDSDDDSLIEYVDEFMNKRFMRTMNYIAIDSYNCGIAWLYIYTDGEEIKYKKLDPLDVIPIWTDDTHESLEGVIRFVTKEEFDGNEFKKKQYVYFYTLEKIRIYTYENGQLEFVLDEAYLEKEDKIYSYKKLPFVYFKQPFELPLIDKVKCLQDALNLLLSNYADNMFENPMNSILVLKNYEGEDLGKFRQNLAQFRSIKVRTADGSQGGVETLEVEVNAENYKVIIEMLKKAIAHNARSLYLDNEKTSNAPNTLNIKAMYSDMELDANAMELEFVASFEYMFDFIGIIENMNFEDLDIQFKRNMMVNEESIVQMIIDSNGIVSEETLRSKHPFVDDPIGEEKRIKREREEQDRGAMEVAMQMKSLAPMGEVDGE